jgi:ankyrin repeat protein
MRVRIVTAAGLMTLGALAMAWAPWLTASLRAATDPRVTEAVKHGDRQAVQRLLNAHVDVNAPEVDGTTPLHWAVLANDLEMIRVLLRAGANVKAVNRYGVMPLSLAATNGDAAVIETLLGAGADPNSALPEGETVLMTAARTGTAAAVKVLLDHGADVKARERWQGETALMWAAAENHADATKLLIASGADLNARSSQPEFPKFAFNGSTMVSTPMPRGAFTALMMAARQGAIDGVRALAEGGADLNLTDPDKTTALVMAIVNGHNEVATLLLEKGADPNIADASGMGALYALVDQRTAGPAINRPSRKPTGDVDSLDLARNLLARGANPNARLRTPILQRFHGSGDPLLTDGATPLMRAAKSTDVAAMRVMLENGANPSLMTKSFATPLMFAAGLGGGRNRTDEDALEAVAVCVKWGADVNAFDKTGQTALHIAVQRSDAIVTFLAEHGAELDIKDKDGRTPLDVAAGIQASAFQGPRGAPRAQVRESTVALLGRLMNGRAAGNKPQAQDARPQGAVLTAHDRAEILQLLAHYTTALQSCAAQEYAELFTPDGVFISDDFRGARHRELYGKSATLVGRAKLIELVNTEEFCLHPEARAARASAASNSARPPVTAVIEPAADGAKGTVAFAGNGRYEDLYVKTADGWRLKSRRVFMPPAAPAR